MADAATPDVGEEKEILPQQSATPASGSNNDPNANVDLTQAAPTEGEVDGKNILGEAQAEVERLSRDLSKAQSRQSEADKRSKVLVRENKRLKSDISKSGNSDYKDDEITDVVGKDIEIGETREAEMKVSRLLLDPKYRTLMDSDPTLLNVLQRNPLIFVDDFIDSEDAVDQTKDMLDERISELKIIPKDNKPEEKTDDSGQQFNAGVPNIRTSVPGGAKTAEDYKNEGNSDMAVESSILSKMGIHRK
jgi:hypothetical protein